MKTGIKMAPRRKNTGSPPQNGDVSNGFPDGGNLPENPNGEEGFITVVPWKKLPQEEDLYLYAEEMVDMGLGEFWRHPQVWEAEDVQEVLHQIIKGGTLPEEGEERALPPWANIEWDTFTIAYRMKNEGEEPTRNTKEKSEALKNYFQGNPDCHSGFPIEKAINPLHRVIFQLLAPIFRHKYPDHIIGGLATAVVESANKSRKISWPQAILQVIYERMQHPCQGEERAL